MPQHTAVGNNASDGMVRPVHPTLPHHCPPAARPCEAPRPVPQRGAREPSPVPWPPSPVLGGLHPQSNSTAVSSPLATFLQLLTGSQQQNRL